MPELKERFRAADRLPARDLWSDISTRVPGSPPPSPVGPRIAAAAVALLIMLVGIVVAVRALRPGPPPVVPAGPKANGEILVYSGPRYAISTMTTDGSAPAPVRGLPPRASLPEWSPDGRRIAFAVTTPGHGEIWVARANGSAAHAVFRCADHFDAPTCFRPFTGLTWSPDGKQIAFILGSMYVMNADGTDVRRLYSQDLQTVGAPPVWSPDGRTILFVMTTPGPQGAGAENNLYLAAADGSGIRQLTRCGPIAYATCAPSWPSWSPDGHTIVFADEVTGSIRTIGVGGGAITTLLAPPRGTSYLNPLWSPDGKLILLVGRTGSKSRVLEANADGTGAHPISKAGAWFLFSWQGIPKGA